MADEEQPETEDEGFIPSIPKEGQAGQIEPNSEGGTQDKNKTGDFDSQSWALNYKGQTVIPTDRQHLLNLAQKGYGAEQSWAEVKKQKQEIESMREKYQTYSEMEENLNANPAFKQELLSLHQKYQNSTDTGEFNPKISELESKFTTFQKQILQEQADKTLNEEISKLKSQYPEENWTHDDGSELGTLEKKVLKFAYDKGINDIQDAFKLMHWDKMILNAGQSAVKTSAQQKQAATRAGIVQGGVPESKPSQGPLDPAKYSYDQLGEMAKAQLQ